MGENKERFMHINDEFSSILNRVYDLESLISRTNCEENGTRWYSDVRELRELYKKLSLIPMGEEILDFQNRKDNVPYPQNDDFRSEVVFKMYYENMQKIMGNILQFELELYPELETNNHLRTKRHKELMELLHKENKEDMESNYSNYWLKMEYEGILLEKRLQVVGDTIEKCLGYKPPVKEVRIPSRIIGEEEFNRKLKRYTFFDEEEDFGIIVEELVEPVVLGWGRPYKYSLVIFIGENNKGYNAHEKHWLAPEPPFMTLVEEYCSLGSGLNCMAQHSKKRKEVDNEEFHEWMKSIWYDKINKKESNLLV